MAIQKGTWDSPVGSMVFFMILETIANPEKNTTPSQDVNLQMLR